MTTKEYLRSVRRMGLEIEIKRERAERLLQLAEGTTRKTNGMHGGQGDPQRTQKCIEEAATMQEEAAEQVAALLMKQKEIMARIDKIQRVELRLVLEMYYLLGWSWDKVAEKMCYSIQHIHRLHSMALLAFLKDESK